MFSRVDHALLITTFLPLGHLSPADFGSSSGGTFPRFSDSFGENRGRYRILSH